MNAHVLRSKREIVLSGAMPRLPVFAMAAESDMAALTRDFQNYHATTESRIQALTQEVERLITVNAGRTVLGNGVDAAAAASAQEEFRVYARSGLVNQVNSSMTVGSDPDGGYTVPPVTEQGILNIARDISPLRQLARVVTIEGAGSEYKMIVSPGRLISGWVGETDMRTIFANPQLVELKFPVNEMYTMPAASQSLLDDSSTDIGQWLISQAALGFSLDEAAAFTSGDANNKPKGFLSYATETGDDFTRSRYDSIQYIPVGSTNPTDVQLADALVAMATKLRNPYRANRARWLLSRAIALRIRQIKDSRNLYVWSQDGKLNNDIEDRLLGFEVAYSEDMPSATSGNYPIALADWSSAYLIVDKLGVRVQRDPYTSKPYVLFYTTKRTGGGCLDFNAIKLLKWSAS